MSLIVAGLTIQKYFFWNLYIVKKDAILVNLVVCVHFIDINFLEVNSGE